MDVQQGNTNLTLTLDYADATLGEYLQTPTHIYFFLALYFMFISYIGPNFMKEKKPYELKSVLLAYNALQVVMNAYIVYKYFQIMGTDSFSIHSNICNLFINSKNIAWTWKNALRVISLYYLTKLVDLLDTVFFVLRKKSNQITVLHVSHHAIMVFATWITVYHYKEPISLLYAAINALVHVIMYSYYLLSSLGPKIQKYLWWKKYITMIQIGQFVYVIILNLVYILPNCKQDTYYHYMWLVVLFYFLTLFLNFYFKSYKKKKPE